jgi:hypothetical protein
MEPVCQELNRFIEENIHVISPNAIVQEVVRELSVDYASEAGVSYECILEHVNTHMLHPNVRMAVGIRNLVQLGDKLQTEIYKQDDKGNQVGVDIKVVDMYMRVHGHIAAMYKMETHKMLFNQGSQAIGNNAASSSKDGTTTAALANVL